ncbi:hypothetical protein E2C01_054099 [Portunus trituberculatus]|uniref:Uncharacterized protein n=1 Tax=Portunus trituberculatus TaxID=210409 RepID=A0A5B7GR09_PORTR|nr:hypothetical protein [Portunus trituberculatus]
MSFSSDDAEAVVSLLLAYRKSQQKRELMGHSDFRLLLKRSVLSDAPEFRVCRRRMPMHTSLAKTLWTIATKSNPDKSSILTSNNTIGGYSSGRVAATSSNDDLRKVARRHFWGIRCVIFPSPTLTSSLYLETTFSKLTP